MPFLPTYLVNNRWFFVSFRIVSAMREKKKKEEYKKKNYKRNKKTIFGLSGKQIILERDKSIL